MAPRKSTAPKAFCFVLMPFAPEFNDVYKIGIREACERSGAYCERVDEQIFSESILERIYNQIAKADIVIADMTGRSANVFYEVGYAHALGKRTILLTQNADDIPFDLKHYPHIVYGQIGPLRAELAKKVKYFVENPADNTKSAAPKLAIFMNETELSIKTPTQTLFGRDLSFYIRNRSSKVIDQHDVDITLVTPHGMDLSWSNRTHETEFLGIEDGSFVYKLPFESRIFPGSSFVFWRVNLNSLGAVDYPAAIQFRLHTISGYHIFPIVIETRG